MPCVCILIKVNRNEMTSATNTIEEGREREHSGHHRQSLVKQVRGFLILQFLIRNLFFQELFVNLLIHLKICARLDFN